MGLSLVRDVTSSFNANNGYVADMSGWDYMIWQFVTPSGTISITSSNDGNEITGSTLPNATTVLNLQATSATLLTDNSTVTSVSAAGLYRVGYCGRFVSFAGASAAAAKVLIHFYKIS